MSEVNINRCGRAIWRRWIGVDPGLATAQAEAFTSAVLDFLSN